MNLPAIKKLEMQDMIFEQKLNRLDLTSYIMRTTPCYRVAVYRNHGFELVENTIKLYLDYADIQSLFTYSAYDDSLSFVGLDITSDALILWLDLSRYDQRNISLFLAERLEYLLTIFTKPILLVTLGGMIDGVNGRIITYDLDSLKMQLGETYLDMRMETFSGTKLSSRACLEISRELGLSYLPSLLKPNLKGVVVDLDNTLYSGVLAEDGVNGIMLTDGHRDLQFKLKELSQKGFYLCAASKNEAHDVEEMFALRQDFPLQRADFTKIYANWDSKAESLGNIIDYLNVLPSSLLFMDDNIGELASVAQAYPDLNLICAKENAAVTFDVLTNYPRMRKLKLQHEDVIRQADVQMNEQRNALKKSMPIKEYLRSLDMEITFAVNDPGCIDRATELVNKTNQFLFTYRRYTWADVAAFTKSTDSVLVTAALKDKLSDSGIIGAAVMKKNANSGVLDECLLSCRSLGRGIEESIVFGMIKVSMDFLGVKNLHITFIKGEKNLPAERFVTEHFSKHLSDAYPFTYDMSQDFLKIKLKENGQS